MKKKVLFVLIFVLLLSVVLAVEDKVYVVDLHYKDGKITVNDIMVKTGYYPDRKLQPEKGYTLDLVSDKEVLYSFKFEVPLKIYTDVIEDEEVRGGIIILNESNFALVLPYFEEAKDIRIYDTRNKEVASASVVPALGERTALKWIFGFIIIFIVLILFFYKRRSRIPRK